MGTHSLIAKQIDTDTYRTVFCQMNGHLEFQGAMLLKKFNAPEQVDKILDLGDLYLLYPILEPMSGGAFLGPRFIDRQHKKQNFF